MFNVAAIAIRVWSIEVHILRTRLIYPSADTESRAIALAGLFCLVGSYAGI